MTVKILKITLLLVYCSKFMSRQSPSAQFRVRGCWLTTPDRAIVAARLPCELEVMTRNGSSLQPVLCTSSESPFPRRGSDNKRTASFSTGSLEKPAEKT